MPCRRVSHHMEHNSTSCLTRMSNTEGYLIQGQVQFTKKQELFCFAVMPQHTTQCMVGKPFVLVFIGVQVTLNHTHNTPVSQRLNNKWPLMWRCWLSFDTSHLAANQNKVHIRGHSPIKRHHLQSEVIAKTVIVWLCCPHSSCVSHFPLPGFLVCVSGRGSHCNPSTNQTPAVQILLCNPVLPDCPVYFYSTTLWPIFQLVSLLLATSYSV